MHIAGNRRAGKTIRQWDCVRIPDGRIGRVRSVSGSAYRIRVRRRTSEYHQFLVFKAGELAKVQCPKGWMSPDGYGRYMRVTLAKMKERLSKRR